MLEQTKNDNIHGSRILIKASFSSSWFKEAVSDIAGTLVSNFAIFALKRYSANKLDLDYSAHRRATNIAGIWFLKTLVTTVSYNFGASLYNYGFKVFDNLANLKNNVELFSILGALEIAEIKSINPSQLKFFSKEYLKARLAMSSLKALGIIIGDTLGSLDIKKLLNFYYVIPRAFVGNFFADATVRMSSILGFKNIGLSAYEGEFKFDVTESINSVSRELSHAGFDVLMTPPNFTGVNMVNNTKELLFRKREYFCDDVINGNKNSSKNFINL